MEASKNILKVGEVYETIIGGVSIGKALYIGDIRDAKYNHLIALRKKKENLWEKIECLCFSDYSLGDGKLNIIYGGAERTLSERQREFLDERLKKSGL